MTRVRVSVLAALVAIFVVAGAGTAWAYWSASGSGGGAVSGDAFSSTSGAKPSVTVAGTSVTIKFGAIATAGSHAAGAYVITRYDSNDANPQIVTSPSCATASGAVTCSLTSVPLGTWHFSYQPQLGNWLGAESSLSDAVVVGATKLVVSSSAVTGVASASATLGPITVEERDASNTAVPAGTGGTSVSLSSTSSGAKFAASSGGSAVTSVTIPSGQTSVTFFYGDTKAGSPTITASNANLASGTQAETINAGAATRIAITGGPSSGAASSTATIGAFTVQQQDQFGNAATSTTPRTLNLSTTANSTGKFAATVGGAATTSVTIAANADSASFYYGDTKAGNPTLTVATSGWSSVTQSVTVTGASPDHFVFTDCSANGGTVTAGACGTVNVTNNGYMDGFVTAYDQFNNLAGIAGGQTLTVQVTSSNSSFVVTNAPVTITGPASKSSTSFHVKYNGTGTASTTLTATAGVVTGTMTVAK